MRSKLQICAILQEYRKMDQEQSACPILPHSKEFLAWKGTNKCPDFIVLKAKQKGRTTLRHRQSEIKIREILGIV